MEAAPGIEPGYRDLQSRDASENYLVSAPNLALGGSLGAAWGLKSRIVTDNIHGQHPRTTSACDAAR